MYKILNWLFGWDYVYYNAGIRRVYTDIYNNPYMILDKLIWIHSPTKGNEGMVAWLTCRADKYIKNKEATNDKTMANNKADCPSSEFPEVPEMYAQMNGIDKNMTADIMRVVIDFQNKDINHARILEFVRDIESVYLNNGNHSLTEAAKRNHDISNYEGVRGQNP